MDLQLFIGVLKRFRYLVLGGFVFAIMLAVFSIARVSFAGGSPSLVYRQPEIFAAQETLQIQRGFDPPGPIEIQSLALLSDYYSRLANSDAVRRLFPKAVQQQQALIVAAPVVSTVSGNGVPTNNLTITGEGPTPGLAVSRAQAESAAFRSYVQQQQTAANIAPDQQIYLRVLNQAAKATVAQPRKKTVALMVFVAIMALTIGSTLLLENLRPRLRLVDDASTLSMDEHRALQPQPVAGAAHADAGR